MPGPGTFRPLHRPVTRAAAVALSICMVFTLTPSMAFAVDAETGLCEHHPVHTVECGYKEAEPGHPCEHKHTTDCYTDKLICGYKVNDDEAGGGIGDETVTASDSDAGHVHTQDCYELYCPHERGEYTMNGGEVDREGGLGHDENCGYLEAVEGQPCKYVCSECGNGNSAGGNITGGNTTGGNTTGGNNLPVPQETKPELRPPNGVDGITITFFDELDEAVRNQSVQAGTTRGELVLPETLSAVTQAGDEDPEPVEIEGVAWEPDVFYEGKTGSYVFTASAEGYTPAWDVDWPAITVTVEKCILTPEEIDALCAAIDALPTVEEIYENAPGDAEPEFNDWVAGTSAKLAEVPALWERLLALSEDAAAMERITGVRAEKLAALNNLAMWLGEMKTLSAGSNDANGDGYHDGDVAVVNAMIDNNGLSAAKDDPASWNFAIWNAETPKRIIYLTLSSKKLINILDISGLTSLMELSCQMNNLTELTGLGSLTNLTLLQCGFNNLTSLDVSGLTKLNTLSCEDNELTELTGLGNLTKLKNLICQNNKLLALTGLDSLTNLELLMCYNNKLTSLDVSGLTKLTTLVCISNSRIPLTFLKLSDDDQLTVINTTGGTVMLTGYTHNTKSVTLKAIADSGYTFKEWTPSGTTFTQNTANPVTFTLSGTITITPVFENKQAVADAQAVAAAKSAIEGGTYTVAQADAGTEDALKTVLARQINALSGMNATGVTVEAGNITVGNINVATAGDADDQDGTNGSFTFTVALSKGAATGTTDSKDGIITATVFSGQTNAQAVAAAKSAIEGGTYTVAQGDAGTEDALKTALAEKINALSGMGATGIIVTSGNITVGNINVATAGDADDQDGTNGSFTFTVALSKGAATGTTDSKDGIITATVFSGQTNAQAVAAAKSAIEGGTYTVAQADAGTEDALKTVLAQQINALSGMSATGITVKADNITVNPFNAAIAGDADDPDGTDGSFTFTVALSKGAATDTTDSKTGTITATAYTGQTNAQAVAAAKSAIEGDTYTVDQADAGTEDALKTALAQQINALSGMSATGITVEAGNITVGNINVATAGDADDPVGTDGSFTFIVALSKGAATGTTDSKDGIITATVFSGQTNAQAVAAAKSAIEGGTYTVAQADAGTEDALKTALAQQINALSGMSATGITVEAGNITVGNINVATAGDADDPVGTDGSFTFTVALSKGAATDTTDSKSGTITATVFSGQTNAQAVAAAKSAIEGGTYTVDQTDAGTEDALKTALAEKINALSGMNAIGITVEAGNITVGNINVATAGDADDPVGTDGSFTFTVALSKGAATDTTDSKSGTITATVFSGQTNAQAVAAAKSAIEGGTYTVDQTDAGTEDALKTALAQRIKALSGMNAAGVTVETGNITVGNINVATAGDADDPDGTDGSFTFTVALSKGAATGTTDSKDGTITATAFSGQTNAQAVAAAKSAIESGTYTVDQTNAGTEDALKTALARQINALSGMNTTGITVTAGSITISRFIAAAAGDAGNADGVNGSFTFTVSLSKGAASVITASKDGVISAIRYISSDATLSSLSLGGVAMNPAFNPVTTYYSASVDYDVSSVTITAVAADSRSTVSGDIGVKSLAVGSNIFTVTVTAEDNSKMTYTITITRADYSGGGGTSDVTGGSSSDDGGSSSDDGGSSSSGSSASAPSTTTSTTAGENGTSTTTTQTTSKDNSGKTTTVTTEVTKDAAGNTSGSAATVTTDNITTSADQGNATVTVKPDAAAINGAVKAAGATMANPLDILVAVPQDTVRNELQKADVSAARVEVILPKSVGDNPAVRPAVTVEKETVDAARQTGKNVTVTVWEDAVTVKALWFLDGQAMGKAAGQSTDLNLGVHTAPVQSDDTIATPVKPPVTAAGRENGLVISFTADGTLLSGAKLTVPATNQTAITAGSMVALYRFDPNTGALSAVLGGVYPVDANGNVTMDIPAGTRAGARETYVLLPAFKP